MFEVLDDVEVSEAVRRTPWSGHQKPANRGPRATYVGCMSATVAKVLRRASGVECFGDSFPGAWSLFVGSTNSKELSLVSQYEFQQSLWSSCLGT